MGYKLGRSSAAPDASAAEAAPAVSTNPTARPSAVKPTSDVGASPSPDVAFYKSAGKKNSEPSANNDGLTASASNPPSPAAVSASSAPADPALAPPADGYYVQVAAVSKQEDGEALVDALKKKQYPAFSANGPDKLFHVQVGPFADIKNAEEMRAKLVSDGYNPILKK
jgi:DedD protein